MQLCPACHAHASTHPDDIHKLQLGRGCSTAETCTRATEVDVQAGKIDAPQQKADRGHQDVTHERCDDLADRVANDDGDGQVDHAALKSELLLLPSSQHVIPALAPSFPRAYLSFPRKRESIPIYATVIPKGLLPCDRENRSHPSIF